MSLDIELAGMARTVKTRSIPSGTLRLKKEDIDPRNSAHYGVSSDTAWYVQFPDGDRSMYYGTRREAEQEFKRIYNFRKEASGGSGGGGGIFGGGDGIF